MGRVSHKRNSTEPCLSFKLIRPNQIRGTPRVSNCIIECYLFIQQLSLHFDASYCVTAPTASTVYCCWFSQVNTMSLQPHKARNYCSRRKCCIRWLYNWYYCIYAATVCSYIILCIIYISSILMAYLSRNAYFYGKQ